MASPAGPEPNSGLAKQVLSSVIISAATFHLGMVTGWLSPMSLKLKKADSPVGTINKDELAILGALPSYASLIITFLISYLAKTHGRKIAFNIIGLSGIVSGLFQTFGLSKEWLYAGRTITSFTFGAINVSLMYITETVHGSIRGTMLSTSTLLFNCGILFSYIFGAVLSYKAYNSVFFILPAAYTTLAIWLPETPCYLMEKSKFDEARKSLLWMRGGNRRVVDVELEAMKPNESQEDANVSLLDILKKKSTRKALIVSTLVYSFQTLSGIHAILNYSGLIFEEAGSFLSPENSSIVTGSILVVATMFNVMLVDRVGRKPLLYLSFIGCTISTSSLTVFLYFHQSKDELGSSGWIPLVSLGFFIVVYGLGLTAVPGTLMNEISSTSIRPAVGAVVMVVSLFLVSIIIQLFPVLDDKIGLYFVFAIPTLFNVLGVFFTRFLVPETKGKLLSQI